ncbi:MAG: NTP transferase domain-containing protein [Methanobacteriaceae archaeon]|jgi:adenosylcobinamide-phosphate guanylyltransferase|nr:NTP transferase domain-containing protein [Methanobacteriaceae archaeon]
MIYAVIMAGGLGTRLKMDVEKPLYLFREKPLIDYVIDNLLKSSLIDDIFVAVSPNTSRTKEYLSSYNKVNIIDTLGNGYVDDLSFLVSRFEQGSPLDTLLFINADLPFISSECIDHVLKKYKDTNCDSLSVYIPSKFLDDLGVKYEYEYNGLVPSGLNILVSKDIIQEEEELIISRLEFAININSLDDVDVANLFF